MIEPNASPLLDLALLDGYLANELSVDDRARVEVWLAADPRHARRLQVMRTLGDPAAAAELTAWDTNRAWSRVAASQGTIRPMDDPHPVWARLFGRGGEERGMSLQRGRGLFKTHPLRRLVWSGVTGVVGVALFFVAGWVGANHWSGRSRSPVLRTYVTAEGQRTSVTLIDGSNIILYGTSRLVVPADYATGAHTVRLIGEGLFTVMHDAGHPFTVLAGPTVTHVLGTSFTIRRYAADRATLVTVWEGKVAVDRTVVSAGQRIAMGVGGVGQVVQVFNSINIKEKLAMKDTTRRAMLASAAAAVLAGTPKASQAQLDSGMHLPGELVEQYMDHTPGRVSGKKDTLIFTKISEGEQSKQLELNISDRGIESSIDNIKSDHVPTKDFWMKSKKEDDKCIASEKSIRNKEGLVSTEAPLIVVNGQVLSNNYVFSMDIDKSFRMYACSGETATRMFGEAGRSGALLFNSKGNVVTTVIYE